VTLRPKDGISLLNASAVSAGLGTLALYDAE
jgi:histidine ammonia-lyase